MAPLSEALSHTAYGTFDGCNTAQGGYTFESAYHKGYAHGLPGGTTTTSNKPPRSSSTRASRTEMIACIAQDSDPLLSWCGTKRRRLNALSDTDMAADVLCACVDNGRRCFIHRRERSTPSASAAGPSSFSKSTWRYDRPILPYIPFHFPSSQQPPHDTADGCFERHQQPAPAPHRLEKRGQGQQQAAFATERPAKEWPLGAGSGLWLRPLAEARLAGATAGEDPPAAAGSRSELSVTGFATVTSGRLSLRSTTAMKRRLSLTFSSPGDEAAITRAVPAPVNPPAAPPQDAGRTPTAHCGEHGSVPPALHSGSQLPQGAACPPAAGMQVQTGRRLPHSIPVGDPAPVMQPYAATYETVSSAVLYGSPAPAAGAGAQPVTSARATVTTGHVALVRRVGGGAHCGRNMHPVIGTNGSGATIPSSTPAVCVTAAPATAASKAGRALEASSSLMGIRMLGVQLAPASDTSGASAGANTGSATAVVAAAVAAAGGAAGSQLVRVLLRLWPLAQRNAAPSPAEDPPAVVGSGAAAQGHAAADSSSPSSWLQLPPSAAAPSQPSQVTPQQEARHRPQGPLWDRRAAAAVPVLSLSQEGLRSQPQPTTPTASGSVTPTGAATGWLTPDLASEPALPSLECLLDAAAAAGAAAATAATPFISSAPLPPLPTPCVQPGSFFDTDGSLLKGPVLQTACTIIRLAKLRGGLAIDLPWCRNSHSVAAASVAAASGQRAVPLFAVLQLLAAFAGAARALQRAEGLLGPGELAAASCPDFRALWPLMRRGRKYAEALMAKVERALTGDESPVQSPCSSPRASE